MNTLRQGQSVTISLSAFSSLAVSTSPSAKATAVIISRAVGLRSSFNVTTVQSTTYGPYGAPTTITFACTEGSMTYQENVVDGLSTAQALSVTARKAIMRPAWERAVNNLGPMQTFVASTGSIIYIDPTSATNGVGTPGDPKNNWPTITDSMTLLGKERTALEANSQLVGFTNTGVVFGTYDAASGERVFDKSRLFTIKNTAFNRVSIKWSGTSGNLAVSGVRLVGGFVASSGGIQLIECNSATGTSTVTVEHCVFEDMGTSWQLVGGFINNQSIVVGGTAKLVARFNRINCPADGVMLSPSSASGGCDIYGNEILTPSNLQFNGPDGIQIVRPGAIAMGHINVYCNWIEQNANSKQGFVLSGGTAQATGDFVYFARNYVWGVDTGVFHALPPVTDANPSIAFVSDSLSGSYVVSNYFDQFAGWVGVGGSSVLMNNVGYRDHIGPWFNGFAANAASTASIIANNTAIHAGGKQISSDTAFEIQGSSHTVANNVAIGSWNRGMRIGATGTTEANSRFSGCITDLLNGSSVPIALATTSSAADAKTDIVGRPLGASTMLGTGVAVRDAAGTLLRFPDPLGFTSPTSDAPNIGAMNSVLI